MYSLLTTISLYSEFNPKSVSSSRNPFSSAAKFVPFAKATPSAVVLLREAEEAVLPLAALDARLVAGEAGLRVLVQLPPASDVLRLVAEETTGLRLLVERGLAAEVPLGAADVLLGEEVPLVYLYYY